MKLFHKNSFFIKAVFLLFYVCGAHLKAATILTGPNDHLIILPPPLIGVIPPIWLPPWIPPPLPPLLPPVRPPGIVGWPPPPPPPVRPVQVGPIWIWIDQPIVIGDPIIGGGSVVIGSIGDTGNNGLVSTSTNGTNPNTGINGSTNIPKVNYVGKTGANGKLLTDEIPDDLSSFEGISKPLPRKMINKKGVIFYVILVEDEPSSSTAETSLKSNDEVAELK